MAELAGPPGPANAITQSAAVISEMETNWEAILQSENLPGALLAQKDAIHAHMQKWKESHTKLSCFQQQFEAATLLPAAQRIPGTDVGSGTIGVDDGDGATATAKTPEKGLGQLC